MCAAAFAATQDFKKDTGVRRKSVRSPQGEGKHVADGYGGGPANVLKKHAMSDDAQMGVTHGQGTREMAMFVASKLKKGSRTNLFTRGRWSVNHYYHMYYDGFIWARPAAGTSA